jgi:hypothetical protein
VLFGEAGSELLEESGEIRVHAGEFIKQGWGICVEESAVAQDAQCAAVVYDYRVVSYGLE